MSCFTRSELKLTILSGHAAMDMTLPLCTQVTQHRPMLGSFTEVPLLPSTQETANNSNLTWRSTLIWRTTLIYTITKFFYSSVLKGHIGLENWLVISPCTDYFHHCITAWCECYMLLWLQSDWRHDFGQPLNLISFKWLHFFICKWRCFYRIWDFHCDDNGESRRLDYDAVWLFLDPTFLKNMLLHV